MTRRESRHTPMHPRPTPSAFRTSRRVDEGRTGGGSGIIKNDVKSGRWRRRVCDDGGGMRDSRMRGNGETVDILILVY